MHPKISVPNDQNHCSLLQQRPGRRAQKRHEGVVYELQAAQRLCYSIMINTVHDRIQNGTPAPPLKEPVDPSLNHSCIHESTRGSTTGILTREAAAVDTIMQVYCLQWDTQTNMST